MVFQLAIGIVIGFLLAVLFGFLVRSAAKERASMADEVEDQKTKEKGRNVLEGSAGSGNDPS